MLGDAGGARSTAVLRAANRDFPFVWGRRDAPHDGAEGGRAALARPHARLLTAPHGSRFCRAERSRARPGSRAGRDVAHAAAFLSRACIPCDECGVGRQVLPFNDKEGVTC
jgi:hypothetical protein